MCENCSDHIEDINTITLNDEEGVEVKFDIIGIVEHNDETYIVVAEDSTVEEPDVIVLLQIKGEEESYQSVDDEDLSQQVLDVLNEAINRSELSEENN